MTTLSDPDRIGRYEVHGRIGHGAMGTVYRAYDPQIGRAVAIKVLHVNDEDLRARFRLEVRTAGTLTHQNIATIYDYGESNGQPFIVMEYVEGQTLAERLRQQPPLPLADALRMIQQLCSALDYAHARDVVHRDIKPANLMLDRRGDVKVVDFGIAKVGDGQLTRAGEVLGTLRYMSPEQIDGAAIDRRSDVFAVGLVLYELVAGQQAFQGDTPSRVMHAILHEHPVPLVERVPGLSHHLDDVVRTAIKKDPAQRYQSLTQLAAELAHVGIADVTRTRTEALSGTLVIKRPESPPVALGEPGTPVREESRDDDRPASRRGPVWVWPTIAAGLLVFGVTIWVALNGDAADRSVLEGRLPQTAGAVRVEFRLAESEQGPGLTPVPGADATQTVYLHPEVALSNDDIESASASYDEFNRPAVRLQVKSSSLTALRDVTGANVGKSLAIVIDGRVLLTAVIQSAIVEPSVQLSGVDQQEVDRIVSTFSRR